MTIMMQDRSVALQMAKAMQGDDVETQAAAWSAFADSVADQIRMDYEDVQREADRATLSARGYRTLTVQESAWYEHLAEALRDADIPNQAFIDILTSDDADELMPDSIIQDVMRELAEQRPLLKMVRFQYTAYSTKWIVNDNSTQKGAWGKIDAKITAEIEGALKVIDVTQNKYSAFCIIPLDILDMGPSYMDAFIRATLTEAMAYGIEDAIINGSGVGMPVGLMRNPNGTFDPETGYPMKEAIKVTSFSPAEYGAICALLAKSEKGKSRVFTRVQLICSMVDYLTKVMPATTVLSPNGAYVHDLFPVPTEVIPSMAIADGAAIVCLLAEYTYCVGGSKNGIIQVDDSCRFLDDARAFKVKTHGAGRAYDNTVAQRLDISELDPAYITVQVAGAAGAAGAPADAAKPTA